MSLKDLTHAKHKEAETQPFIKAIFKKQVSQEEYADYLYQLAFVYHVLEEDMGNRFKLFDDMPELKRATLIRDDFNEISNKQSAYFIRNSTLDYINYLMKITDEQNAMAHVYVRHMGDLFGGQALAKLVPGSGKMFKFENKEELVGKIRSKLNDDMADEANIAFDYNIKMVKEYN
jgi:heme oxygenase